MIIVMVFLSMVYYDCLRKYYPNKTLNPIVVSIFFSIIPVLPQYTIPTGLIVAEMCLAGEFAKDGSLQGRNKLLCTGTSPTDKDSMRDLLEINPRTISLNIIPYITPLEEEFRLWLIWVLALLTLAL